MGITYVYGTDVTIPRNNWVLGRDQVIKAALRKLGVLASGATPSTAQVTDAAEALNAMVKEWDNDPGGVHLWKVEWKTANLAQDVDHFGLAEEALAIEKAFLRESSGIDYPVSVVEMPSYFEIGEKADTGRPTVLAVQPGSLITCYLWRVPDVGTYILHYLQTTRLKDFDAAGDNPDFPVRWTKALIYGLAHDLSDEYGIAPDDKKRLLGLAEMFRERARRGGNREIGSPFVTPAYNDEK